MFFFKKWFGIVAYSKDKINFFFVLLKSETFYGLKHYLAIKYHVTDLLTNFAREHSAFAVSNDC